MSWGQYARAMDILALHGIRNFVHAANYHEDDPQKVETRGIDNALAIENLRHWYGRRGVLVYPTQVEQLLPLQETLKLCLRFQSTKRVDKIFALLGLISDREELAIAPNYDDSQIGAIFTNATIKMIERGKRDLPRGNPFRLLRFAGIGGARQLNDIPSWVPDWTSGVQTCVLSVDKAEHTYRASLDSKPDIRISTFGYGMEIKSQGTIVATLSTISAILTGDPKLGESPFLNALHIIQGGATSINSTLTGDALEDEFWRTTLGDMDTNGRPASNDSIEGWKTLVGESENLPREDAYTEARKNHESSRRLLQAMDTEDNKFRHLLSSDLSHANQEHQGSFGSILGARTTRSFLNRYPLFAFGRRMCMTKNGYIGLVPEGTKLGDVVAIFPGASTPHILRPGRHPHWLARPAYELVGECYLHGAMDGELFRGATTLSEIIIF
jgi:hypothetical protein